MMLKKVLLSISSLALFLVILIATIWFGMQPPSVLDVQPQGFVITNATIINPGINRTQGQTIRVEGGKITAIETTPVDSTHINRFAGKFVLPGLIDMHVHHAPAFDNALTELTELLYLLHGVTTIRDVGNFDGGILRIRSKINSAEMVGPRIFTCGNILDGDPIIWPKSEAVNSIEDASVVVEKYAKQGVNCIKTYSHLRHEVLVAIQREAKKYQLPVIGHVPWSVAFENAHLTEAQHFYGVPKLPLFDPTVTPGVESAAYIKAWDSIDQDRIDFIIKTSLEQNIAHTPTVTVFNHNANMDQYLQQRAAASKYLPRIATDVIWAPKFDSELDDITASFATKKRSVKHQQKLVFDMITAGVKVYAGSDAFNAFVVPGVSLHEELGLFVDAGLSPEQAWQAATNSPGKALSTNNLGLIISGAPADLLIFSEDPSLSLNALDTLEAVITQGRVYSKKDLEHAFKAHREHMSDWLYDTVSMSMETFLSKNVKKTEHQ